MEKYLNENGMYTLSIEPSKEQLLLEMHGYYQGTDLVLGRKEVLELVAYLQDWLNNFSNG